MGDGFGVIAPDYINKFYLSKFRRYLGIVMWPLWFYAWWHNRSSWPNKSKIRIKVGELVFEEYKQPPQPFDTTQGEPAEEKK